MQRDIRRALGIALVALTMNGCECGTTSGGEDGDAAGVGVVDGGAGGVVDAGAGGGDTVDAGPRVDAAGDPDGGRTEDEDDGGASIADDGSCIPGLTAIALEPVSIDVTLAGQTAAPVSFTATATVSGASVDLDEGDLAWSVSRDDDTDPGAIAAGELSPNPTAGGVVTVTASDGCVTGTATVVFHLSTTIGAPADAAAWSGGVVDASGTVPLPVYPSDETRIPRNVHATVFQWERRSFSSFRLTFSGPYAEVTVFTDGAHPLCDGVNDAGCWQADNDAWTMIAASNAGELVGWTVEALDTSTTPATIRRSTESRLGVSKRDVRGAIFYWSTTSKGVRRANIADAEPEDYITGDPQTSYPDDTAVKCVACHTVSRDGRFLAAPVDATSGKSLWLAEVTATAPPRPLVTHVDDTGGHLFATFSPDNEHVVVATKDSMFMVDRASGGFLEDLPISPYEATHPDWSPDDTRLVFSTKAGDAPGGASLALLPRENGAWGTPTLLLAPEGDRTLVYPMFSPDGDWLAYTQGKGGHGDNQMLLFVTDPDAPVPVELGRANRVVNNHVTDGMHQNAGPTWAPPGDLYWIAFNSKREYGLVLGEGTQQIWVAAVDPALLGGGDDPSFPAFRLPFQLLDENNHRAFWALDVRVDLPPDGGPPVADDVDGGPDDVDAGPPDAGPPVDAGIDAGPGEVCATTGELCDPSGAGCCSGLDLCDTLNSGETYICLFAVGG